MPCSRLRRFAEGPNESLEVLRFTEIAIDAGKADVGHRIHLTQRVHHQLADLLRGNVALTRRLELPDDTVDDTFDSLLLDRALVQRDTDRARQLVAVERHAAVVGLHHRELAQLGALDGGEALAAVAAEAAPADRAAVLARTAVLHLRVFLSTERAAHDGSAGIEREACAQ